MIAANVKPWVYQGRGQARPWAPSETGKSLRMHASEVAMKHIKGKSPVVAARYFEILHRVHAEIIAAKVHTRQEIEEAFDARFPGSADQPSGDHAGVGDHHPQPAGDHAGAPASDSGHDAEA